MKKYIVKNNNLLYPELSFKINGVLFDVHNALGSGHKEKIYQGAVREALKNSGLLFREQVYVPIVYNNIPLGKYYLDFLIEEKIVLELKQGRYISHQIINQVVGYLEVLNLELAIIGCFAHDCVIPKRIVRKKNPL